MNPGRYIGSSDAVYGMEDYNGRSSKNLLEYKTATKLMVGLTGSIGYSNW